MLHSKSAEMRIVAIAALAHVADPVVIPSLAAAIRQNPYAGNLFSAFLNFPENGQAADTVISLLEIGGDTAERAGSVLRSLAARTKDTQIKSRIERPLHPELRR